MNSCFFFFRKSQGKFLVKMISLSLSEANDADKFERTLVKLAEVHNERGVKAVEYGIVGEVLLWAIRSCVGHTTYTSKVNIAWVKVYSRMLRTMVPVAVTYELQRGSGAQDKRFTSAALDFSNELVRSSEIAGGSMKADQTLVPTMTTSAAVADKDPDTARESVSHK